MNTSLPLPRQSHGASVKALKGFNFSRHVVSVCQQAYAALTFDAMRKEKKAALFQHLFDTSCRSTCHASLFGIAQSTSEHAILLRHQQCKLQQTGFGNYRVPRNQLVSSLLHVLMMSVAASKSCQSASAKSPSTVVIRGTPGE